MSSSDNEWQRACAAALAGFSDLWPQRLSALLRESPPAHVWEELKGGAGEGDVSPALARFTPDLLRSLQRQAQQTNPLNVVRAYSEAGMGVWARGADYPNRLVDDPWGPGVVFYKGRSEPLNRPTVAIVGTRRCSYEGRAIARSFGAGLSEAGVTVISGLALGIDGAAHEGALSVSSCSLPLGVVGSGLDVVYPKRHGNLWKRVADEGLLLSEAPMGTPPDAWRFPARNRIIAGLADVMVVVESHHRGGSLLSAHEALKRSVPVMAVPGSIRSNTARGTNALIADGAAPATSVEDVLCALSLVATGRSSRQPVLPVMAPSVDEEEVLEAIDRSPTTTDEIAMRTHRPLADLSTTLFRLQEGGWIRGAGGWWQRIDEEVS